MQRLHAPWPPATLSQIPHNQRDYVVHDHVLRNRADYVVFVIVWPAATVHAAAACVRSYLTMSYVIYTSLAFWIVVECSVVFVAVCLRLL